MPLPSDLLIALIPLLPLLGAAFNGLFGNRFPRWWVGAVACLTVAGSFVASVLVFYELSTTGQHALSSTLFTWITMGSTSIDFTLTVDRLSGIMVLVVTGVGSLIHVYSLGYMSHERSLARYFSYLNLFMFAMLVLVLGDSLPVMFLGWEGVGLCSYLLIGFWFSDNDKASAGKKAFITNRIGDFGFIIAMLLLYRYLGTLSFEGLTAQAAAGNVSTALATGVCLMLFLGAAGKSAQIPLYVWLPDAMAGPTPVSALIHAATMVTAGVYMVARMGFMFTLAPTAMIAVALVGAATALFAATIGTAQNDIKKVLAYSTVSQLGFMFIAAGVGAYAVAIFHVVTHAFFKACLFLGSGSVIHGMSGEQDMRQMGGLWKRQPITFATFLISTLAITGFPLTAGFISKDAILWNAFASDAGTHAEVFGPWAKLVWVVGVVAAGFTAYYMWRAVFLTFFSGPLRAPKIANHVHESPVSMTAPLVLLAVLALAGGALGWPHIFGGHDWIVQWLAPVVGASPAPEGSHIGLEILLMSVSVGAGVGGFVLAFLLFAKRIHPFANTFASERPWQWLHARLSAKWHVDELYDVICLKPIGWVSNVVLYRGVDRILIDGTVNFVGWFARTIGFVFQLFQSGNAQRYLAVFAIALAILLYGWLTPATSSSESVSIVVAPAGVVQVPGAGGGR